MSTVCLSIGDRDYKLVVVCTTENEYRARIVAALEKFRRPSPALSTTNMVRNYLRTRFATNLHNDGVQSAAFLDPERYGASYEYQYVIHFHAGPCVCQDVLKQMDVMCGHR